MAYIVLSWPGNMLPWFSCHLFRETTLTKQYLLSWLINFSEVGLLLIKFLISTERKSLQKQELITKYITIFQILIAVATKKNNFQRFLAIFFPFGCYFWLP